MTTRRNARPTVSLMPSRAGPPAGGPAARWPGSDWPLVGRAEEISFVWEVLRGAAHGGVVISGAPGIGKTRLAREVLAVAARSGWAVERAAGTEAAQPIAFGAVARLAPSTPDLRPPTTMEVLARFGAELAARAAGRPVLLMIDDVHLVDNATATLVHQLCIDGVGKVLLTLRRGQIPPDAVSALWKDGMLRRLELQPLSMVQMDQLLGQALGGVIVAPTRRLLWNACAGNVFALRELVASGLESGRLAAADDVWRWDGALAIGASMDELVRGRLSSLSPAEREAMEIVALGAPLDMLSAAAAGYGAALASLERAGLVVSAREGQRWQLRPAHPLYGEGVRSAMGMLAVHSARRAAAEMVISAGLPGRNDALRVAVWRLEGGPAPDADLLLTAARQARGLADHRLCERLARAACAAGGGFEPSLLLAGALSAQSRWAEAESVCTVPPLSDPPTGADRCRVALILAEVLFWGFGRTAEAADMLASAAAEVKGTPGAECSALRGALAMFGGDLAQSIRAAQDALDAAGVADRVVVRALLCAVPSLALSGQTEAAIAQGERGLELFTRGVESPTSWQADLVLGHSAALRFAGRIGDALALSRGYYDRALSEHDHSSAALAALALGQAELDSGAAMSAVILLREAAALLRRFDQIGALPWCLAHLVRAAVLVGESERAEQEMAALEAMSAPVAVIFATEIGRARTWLAVGRGEISAARTLAGQSAAWAESMGQLSVAAAEWHDLARLGDARTAADRLERLSTASDGVLVQAFAEHAAALADRDPASLELLAGRFDQMGAHLLAGEAAQVASDGYRVAGRPGAALGCARMADTQAALCPGVRTAAMRRVFTPSPLTAREQEIAGLAARGLANAEIAKRLHLSVRTVEGHLQQVYVKLDLHSRDQLPAL